MRKKIKIITLLFAAIPALFLSSCEVEEKIITNETKSSSYNVKNIFKNEIDSNLEIANKLQILSSQKTILLQKREHLIHLV